MSQHQIQVLTLYLQDIIYSNIWDIAMCQNSDLEIAEKYFLLSLRVTLKLTRILYHNYEADNGGGGPPSL